ncbi:5-oxoprolinase subunit PxpA [uncultured Kriegella sp.]|uniref:5-oxoprolinase subunit PxpA n=1 Tax=uncultured Kriegella sp. TaxID=1798910 RepID=UPI0030DC9417|tara:strand:+ start:370110 stop:370853 length:744 start_codon:yes stop_codon:yes gene_type:complete
MNEVNIDINCDVGEGLDNEHQLFQYISSCSIACGGHAGNRESMEKVARLAKESRIKIGAHPSYPDRPNFGRRTMEISSEVLAHSIQEQIRDLESILDNQSVDLHHIKAHGALYNDMVKNTALASTFLSAIEKYKERTFIYVPYGSTVAVQALKRGFKIKYEAFADRSYNVDLGLVSRSHPKALIQDCQKVLQHLLFMVKHSKVSTVDAVEIKMRAETFCIHGDSPSALRILMYLDQELPKHNIKIKR